MVVGVLGSVRAFAVARPPLVAFAFCIFGFALTTVSLAYYVRHNNNIAKPETEMDWKNFLKLLSTQELCVTPRGLPEPLSPGAMIPASDNMQENVGKHNVGKQNVGRVTLSVVGNLTTSVLPHISPHDNNGSMFSGNVILKGWNRVCSSADPQDESKASPLLMNVYIPPIPLTVSGNNTAFVSLQTPVCVTVTGPIHLLPFTQDENAEKCASISNQVAASMSVGHFIARGDEGRNLGEKQNDGWCKTGEIVHIAHEDLDENTPTILLTDDDRSLIHLHLLHTSYLLLGLALALVLYAALRGRHLRIHHILISDKDPLDP